METGAFSIDAVFAAGWKSRGSAAQKSNRTQRSIPFMAYEDGALEKFSRGATAAFSEFMISRSLLQPAAFAA